MLEPMSRIAALRRPQILVDAARFGIDQYDRARLLPRLIGPGPCGPARAVTLLLDREAEQEQRRRAGTGDYRPARHVELIVALMAEARLWRAARPS
ncbi:hypothetical protein FHS00_000252 [Limimaricola variabilis]|uniref:Uncharacterized protein n=1 Tax=Limimaricola variabilis TaxID=1492771 RepID=A0ABR6HJY1_9RHOB|nr:DUF6477 family protein [Limimaricola variabilis]MBB3710699.1 hypothetical protein [Limimaricola variabilis]